MRRAVAAVATILVASGCSAVLGIEDRSDGHLTCADGGCTCAEGFDDCNDDRADGCEAELATDADNCGVCGRSCRGGPCVDGVCGPTLIASAHNPAAIALHDGLLYFTDAGASGIFRVPASGGTAEHLAEGSGRGKPDRPGETFVCRSPLVVAGDRVYWGDEKVHVASLDGTSARVLQSEPVQIKHQVAGVRCCAIAVGSNAVYVSWGTKEPYAEINAVPSEGPPKWLKGLGSGASADLALDEAAGRLYWGDPGAGRLHAIDLATGADAVFVRVNRSVARFEILERFVFSDGELYFTAIDPSRSEVAHAPAQAGGLPVALAFEPGAPFALRLFEHQVYWTNVTAGLIETFEDGSRKTLASGQTEPTAIEVDADFVYFGSVGGLWRAPR